MPVQSTKIRLGAPTSMWVDWNLASQVELGASTGGAQLAYNATYLPIEIDQTIVPVSAFKTKEEAVFSVSLVQRSATNTLIAFSLATDLLTTTAATAMTTPTGVTGVPQGTPGSTSYSYQVAAIGPNGDSIPSTAVVVATGAATLSAATGILVSWAANSGAFLGYRVIRSASAGTPASTGVIAVVGPTATSFLDTGLPATAYTPSAVNPTNSAQDKVTFGGRMSVPFHTFDWLTPKNDGTGNMWLGHMARCFSARQVTTDEKRDKVTEVSKVELMAIGDMTQNPGLQLGYVCELY